VSGLAGCLIAIAAWFARRAARETRRSRTRARLSGGGPAPLVPGARRSRRPSPVWLPWLAAGGLAGWIVWSPWGVAAGAALGALAMRLDVRRRGARVAALRDEQLADAVGSIAAALRAGRSVPQALEYAADETPPPLADGLREVVREVDVGVPTEVALDRWAASLDTGDARLLAGVIHLHRRSGGDLPSVLDQVVATLHDRRDAAREVRSLTAQARLSGAILGLLPIAFFAFLWLTSRSDIEGALGTTAGVAAIAVGLVMEGLAFIWIRALLEVR
jgi:tight adherence protein B